MKASVAIVTTIMLGWGLAGCASTGTDHPSLATLETPAAPTPGGSPAEPAPAASRGSFLDGPIGARLAMADRDAAFKAETDALSSGNRKTWRGQKGAYGFVVPDAGAAAGGAPSADGSPAQCRSFTHTIYFAGRPQVGHGTGCREPDGSWRVTG